MEYLNQLVQEHGNGKRCVFAEKLGTTRSTITHWFDGRHKPSVSLCLKMRDMFNADLSKIRPDIWG